MRCLAVLLLVPDQGYCLEEEECLKELTQQTPLPGKMWICVPEPVRKLRTRVPSWSSLGLGDPFAHTWMLTLL